MRKSTFRQHAVIHIVLITLGVFFLMPFAWMVSTSLKPVEETQSAQPEWIPRKQEEHTYLDKNDPLYETTHQGNDVKGSIVARGADGDVSLKISEPQAFSGVTIHKNVKDLKVVDRTSNVVTVPTKDGPQKAFVISREADETTVRLLSNNETLTVRSEQAKPVYHVAPQWHNYADAITYGEQSVGYIPFLEYARNTLFVCILVVAGTVVSNSIVAYSFARLRWRGRDVAFGLTLATMMVPFPVLMVPIFSLFVKMDWVGTFRPLWVPAWFGSAFSIFLLRQFFLGIPFELSEAAKIDGCSEWRIFTRVIAPLAKPAIAVAALFAFMGAWNDFLGPLVYLHSQDQFTLSLGLQFYRSQQGTSWHLLMAASTVVVAPVIVLFFFTQRLFIRGIAATGLKG
ncbi:MAG TPA: carbohydrate ABC transporter permease [Fimbriimonadaceae bacterium]|nr:carbohydrate ABC transporter permease [Fimbriimonadaceae bacterium]